MNAPRNKFYFLYRGTMTLCQLNPVGGKFSVSNITGKAVCSPEDQFCKRVGRRIALTDLLHKLEATRPERKAVWADYFAIHNDLRKGARP